MPSQIVLKLRDGAVAVVSVGVSITDRPQGVDPARLDQRERDLENILGGVMAGTITREIIIGQLVELRASVGPEHGGPG